MNGSYLYLTIIGWSIVLTLGYRWGFAVGRKAGRINVIQWIKQEKEKGKTILVSDSDEEIG